MNLMAEDLLAYLHDTFGLEGIDETVPLFSSALLDSINMVEVVSFLEDRTGLIIEAADLTLENFDTVDSIITFANSRAS